MRRRSSMCFVALLLALAIQMLGGFCESIAGEGKALMRFRDRMEIDPYGALAGWRRQESGIEDHCFWFGIQCSDGRVVSLDLKNLYLKGTLGPEIAMLSHLRRLILHNNSFYGTVPREIVELHELEVLDLEHNNLSGSIPSKLTSILSPETLVLTGNRFTVRSAEEEEELISSINGPLRRKVRDAAKRKLNSASPVGSPPHLEFPPPSSLIDPASSLSKALLSIKNVRRNLRTVVEATKHTPSWVIYVSIIGGVFSVGVLSLLCFFCCRENKNVCVIPGPSPSYEQSQKPLVCGDALALKRSDIEAACEDFSNVIGSSSDCTLYKGTLTSGVEIAVSVMPVKDWPANSNSRFKEKMTELSRVDHKNFMNLLGYCEAEPPFPRMTVFEYAPNGTLFEHLHIREAEHLDWDTRLRIVMGIAYCLEHLHQLEPPVILRDLTSSTVFLAEDYSAKVSDLVFGISGGTGEGGEEESGVFERSTTIRPASISRDPRRVVYKFGVVLLEILSGRRPFSEDYGLLVQWASSHLNGKRPLRDMIDSTLQWFREEDIGPLCEVIRSCIAPSRRKRATMAEVASRLRAITSIAPAAAASTRSPLTWAELQLLSIEAS